MPFLNGFLVLIGLLFIGDFVSEIFTLPIPGSVIGMLLLLTILCIRGEVSNSISVTADGLIKYIGLLFIPAGAGISLYLGLIADNWLIIFIATGVSTTFTLIICAWLFQWLSKKEKV